MFGFFKEKKVVEPPIIIEPPIKRLILKRYYCNNGNYTEVKKDGKTFKHGTTIGAVIDPAKPNFPPLFYTIEPAKLYEGEENNSDNLKTKANESSCILAGIYQCIITYSNRFKKLLYLVKNTLGRKGVRLHSGNSIEDSQGCILPCERLVDNFSRGGIVYDYYGIQSVKALAKLHAITLDKDFILEIDDKDQQENFKLITKYKGY